MEGYRRDFFKQTLLIYFLLSIILYHFARLIIETILFIEIKFLRNPRTCFTAKVWVICENVNEKNGTVMLQIKKRLLLLKNEILR